MLGQKCVEKENHLEGNVKLLFPHQATRWQCVLFDAATYKRTDNPPKVSEDNIVYLFEFYLSVLNTVTAGN